MIVIRRRDPEQHMARFHFLAVQAAFHGWDLVHEWGRIGSPGTVRHTAHGTQDAAEHAAASYHALKRRKGYA
jgi:predicted DNA-binding WGR domain protein